MQKTILQVPLDTQLKISAEKVAEKQGFSSLQEVIRVFLTQLATNKVEVSLQHSIPLSPENDKRYGAMTKDFESGKDVYPADNVDDLISRLNEN